MALQVPNGGVYGQDTADRWVLPVAEALSFIDASTKSVSVRIISVNMAKNLFIITEVKFDIFDAGLVEATIKATPLRIRKWSTIAGIEHEGFWAMPFYALLSIQVCMLLCMD